MVVDLELVNFAMRAIDFFHIAAHLEALDCFLEKCWEGWLRFKFTLVGRAALRDVVVSRFMLPIAHFSRAILILSNGHAATDMIPLDNARLLWLRHFDQSVVLRRRLLLLCHAFLRLKSVLAIHHTKDHCLALLLDVHVPGVSFPGG